MKNKQKDVPWMKMIADTLSALRLPNGTQSNEQPRDTFGWYLQG